MFPINISFTMDYDNYENLYLFSFYQKSRYQKSIKSYYLQLLLIIIPISILLFVFIDRTISLIFFLVFSILGLYNIVELYYILPKSIYKKNFRTSIAPEKYSFNETYFETIIDSDQDSKTLKTYFSELFKFSETKEGFYLFVSSTEFTYIPKKFLTEVQTSQIRDAILKNVDVKNYKKYYKE